MYVIDFIVFVHIVLRDENPEYKIPWFVCMFILHVWTIAFSLIFVRNKMRKRDRKIVEPTKKMLVNRRTYFNNNGHYEIYLPCHESYTVKLGSSAKVSLFRYEPLRQEYVGLPVTLDEGNTFLI